MSTGESKPLDRRRKWLLSRGLISPHPGPTRRLASLLPRKRTGHTTTSTSSTSHPSSPPPRSVRLEHPPHAAVPVVVVPSIHCSQTQHSSTCSPAAMRTLSMPVQSSSARLRSPFRSRSIPASRRSMASRAFESASSSSASPSSHASRLFRLRRRKKLARTSPPQHQNQQHQQKSKQEYAAPPPSPTSSSRPQSQTLPPPRTRNVYTVVDRDIPPHVLQGSARFPASSWTAYRERMDELGRDETFMQYLTAPVHSPGMNLAHTDLSSGSATTPHQLAVNKLYPLAFIRLLEAQARFAAQTELADRETEAADEKHRYDDPVDDDMPAMRGRSGAAFDMRSRFRSVGGNCIENGTQVTPKEVKSRAPENMMRLIRNRRGNANETEGRGDTNHLFQPIDGDCRNMAFVPVC